MDRPDQTTHFGFRDVALGDKQTLVNDVFHSVAQRYDLMNDLMSAGLHRAWKDVMINALNPPRSEAPFALLDVAGGTGDIAFRAAKAAGPGFQATVCDINSDMLSVGRERAAARHLEHEISFVEGNAEALAFPDRFDEVLIGFGVAGHRLAKLRNHLERKHVVEPVEAGHVDGGKFQAEESAARFQHAKRFA